MPLKPARKHRPSRRKNPSANAPNPTAPIAVLSFTPAGNAITITFDQPVAVHDVPAYTTDIGGAVAVSAAMTSPTTMQLTFDADVSLAAQLNVPYEDPGVRNASGGFVTPTSIAA